VGNLLRTSSRVSERSLRSRLFHLESRYRDKRFEVEKRSVLYSARSCCTLVAKSALEYVGRTVDAMSDLDIWTTRWQYGMSEKDD